MPADTAPATAPAPGPEPAPEPPHERLAREHRELLEELRALIPGAEVLFGFLLAIRFTNQFGELQPGQRQAYYATLVLTVTSLVLFMAPAVHHRVRFREGEKDEIVRKGNREALVGSVTMCLALTGAIYLVTHLVFGLAEAIVAAASFFAVTAWRWWAIALLRAWQGRGQRRGRAPA